MRWRWRLCSWRVVTPANLGGQDVEVGDVFVEVTETVFLGVEFAAWRSQNTARPEEIPLLIVGGSRPGRCDMLTPISEP
jgi:hypothetical protein